MLIKRSERNPILKPKKEHSWEAEATFNGCPVKDGSKIHLVYRAMSLPHYKNTAGIKLEVSNIGIAESKNGVDFLNRKPFITPEYEWEKFGCEDPRVTKLDGKHYIFYTALSEYPFRKEGIKVAVAISKDLEKIEEKHLVTPFNAKAMALFPEKIDGKIWVILTPNTDNPPAKIALASFDKEEDIWNENIWNKWYKNLEKNSLNLLRSPNDQVEVGIVPIKTKEGWLMIYSYIKNYFSPNHIFTFEAVLLDLKNPLKIIARTDIPLMVPEEYYEKKGAVQNVIFPSGAFLEKNTIHLYYGSADTTCSLALVNLPFLLNKMLKRDEGKLIKLLRAKENPIILPIKEHSWESRAVFNPTAIYLAGKTHIIYRAMSEDNTSVFGYVNSKDGINIDYRSNEPIYIPRESFEQKLVPNGNSGCEDPRITIIKDTIYMCYTAYDGKNPPRVALSSIKEKDFLAQKWNWSKPILISRPDTDDKDACIFPEKINGKYFVIHRIGNDINSAFVKDLNFDDEKWLEEYIWIEPRIGMWDNKKVGIASTPIKTKDGWLLFYHGVSEEDSFYRLGVCLLDLKDPTKIIARLDEPIFEPEEKYEREGQIPNVVFPCGIVKVKDKIFVYYGGADSVVGVATILEKDLLKILKIYKN